MTSLKKFLIASIVYIHTSVFAISISADFEANQELVTLNSRVNIKPAFSDNTTQKIKYLPLNPEIDRSFHVESASLAVHGLYPYSDKIGIYARVGASHPLGMTETQDKYLFAQGSLLADIHTSPFIALGGQYLTQSGSIIEAGFQYKYMKFDLSTQSDGGLFNGWPSTTATGIGANNVGFNLKIGLPFAEKFMIYSSAQLSAEWLSSELPFDPKLTIDQTSSLQEYPVGTNPKVGNLVGREVNFLIDYISLGIRFNITNI